MPVPVVLTFYVHDPKNPHRCKRGPTNHARLERVNAEKPLVITEGPTVKPNTMGVVDRRPAYRKEIDSE